MKRAIILPSLVTAFLALSPAGIALADNAHNGNTTGTTTGQPNQSAGSPNALQSPPGQNTAGFANAETHYANPDSTGGVHSNNPKVVSQYDVAAFQFSNKGP
ncbi:MAG: hypothetical protein ACJ74F_30545 [Mycobacterium sp.]|jgi:hypothetical protein|uniref:hypothetical protein n=1 Tax=Mycobacterium sp. TaxID=1785 RepID=UPI00389AD6FF